MKEILGRVVSKPETFHKSARAQVDRCSVGYQLRKFYRVESIGLSLTRRLISDPFPPKFFTQAPTDLHARREVRLEFGLRQPNASCEEPSASTAQIPQPRESISLRKRFIASLHSSRVSGFGKKRITSGSEFISANGSRSASRHWRKVIEVLVISVPA